MINKRILFAITNAEIDKSRLIDESIDLKDRFFYALDLCADNWLLPTEQVCLTVALAHLTLHLSNDEKVKFDRSVTTLKAIDSAMSGVPVDFEALQFGEGEQYPLIGWFHEWRDRRKG